jgi:hypothetical protein
MGIILSLSLATTLRQVSVSPVFCLVYSPISTKQETVDQFRKLKTANEVNDFAIKGGFRSVELQPGNFAILPDHSKLQQYLESRRAIFNQCIFEGTGKLNLPVSTLSKIGDLNKSCRQVIEPSARSLGLLVDKSTPYYLEVDATFGLANAGQSVSVPVSRRRTLTPEAEVVGRSGAAHYDSSRVLGVQDSIDLAISKRPNVELSTGNITISTWGAVKTNSRIAKLSQLAMSRLVEEYTALEKTALKDEKDFAVKLGDQSLFWRGIKNADGGQVSTLDSDVIQNLSSNLYSNATSAGLTDQESVDRYLQGASISNLRLSITCYVWARFPDGKISLMGIGLF